MIESLPDWLTPTNAHRFPSMNSSRLLLLLREELYNYILSRKDENEYFDIEDARRRLCPKISRNDINNLLNSLIEELHNLGWKTTMAFGYTGLFVFSTENPPSSCW